MIVLDTHAWLWWINDEKDLTPKAKRAIHKAANNSGIYISSISVWEITMLVEKKRLSLSMNIRDWIKRINQLSYVQFVPVDNNIAIESVLLPGTFHKDPADRLIVSTARTQGFPLVSGDAKILEYEHVKTIW